MNRRGRSGVQATQPFKGSNRTLGKLTTTAERSAHMARVRRTATGPELMVRAAFTAAGVRYTTDNRDLPGSPDLANRRRGFAVFVHGCFWHRHAGCSRTTTPARNREFWEDKFAANVRRDRRAVAALRRRGYRVMVIWECRTRQTEALSGRVERFIRARSSPSPSP